MSFPRIDHPEFAAFIRRLYGVGQHDEPVPGQASRVRAPIHDAGSKPSPERLEERRSSRRTGGDEE